MKLRAMDEAIERNKRDVDWMTEHCGGNCNSEQLADLDKGVRCKSC